MLRRSASVDLSEFFNDDDSEGHRLVEFIQKRRGNFEKKNCVLMNYEPQRLSLNVQVEKNSSSHRQHCNEKNDYGEKVCNNKVLSKNNIQDSVETPSPSRTIPTISSVTKRNTRKVVVSPSIRNRSEKQFQTPISVRKRILSNDKLRQRSFSVNNKGGRRTLLNEFQNTVDDGNFDPLVCSTPFCHPQSSKRLNYALDTGDSLFTRCREDVTCLKEKDEVEKCMESSDKFATNTQCSDVCNNETNTTSGKCPRSPLKRAYTVENKSVPGNQESNNNKSKSLISEKQNTSFQHPNGGVSISNPWTGSKTSQINTSIKQMSQQDTNAPLETNICIGLSTRETEIPDKDDQKYISTNSVVIQSDNVVQVNQNCNETCKESTIRTPVGESNTKGTKNAKAAKPTPEIVETNSKQYCQLIEDDLKLTDILTDDDDHDELLKSQTVENSSQVPINLASTTNTFSRERLRKRSFLRRRLKNNLIHLNKEPGRSVDGEELQEITTYKILDLRKQNCEFHESVELKEEIPSSSRGHLIGQIPSDRTSFKKNGGKKQSKFESNKRMPEVLVQYLEVSATLGRNKYKDSTNISKRSLYSQDNYELKENAPPSATNGSINTIVDTSSPSPHHNLDLQNLKVNSKEVQRCTKTGLVTNLSFTKSPLLGDYRSDSATLTNIHKCNKSNTFETCKDNTETINVKTNANANNETHIFKIPKHLAPRTKRQKEYNISSKSLKAEEQASYNSDSTNGILRRSKRAHVSLNNNPSIFQILFEKVTNKNFKKYENNKKVQRKKEREINKMKNKEIKDSTPTSAKSKKTRKPLTKKKHPTVPENCTSGSGDCQENILNEKRKKKTKPQNSAHQEIQNDEEIEIFERKPLTKKKHPTVPENGTSGSGDCQENILNEKRKKKTKPQNSAHQEIQNDEEIEIFERKPLTKKKHPTVPENGTFGSGDCQENILNEKRKKKTKPQNSAHQEIQNDEEIEIFESRGLILGSSSHVDLQNNALDQIRSTSSLKTKPFKIRVARLKPLSQLLEHSKSVSATSKMSIRSSNYELISWLKHISNVDAPMIQNTEIINNMRISPAYNLTFTELQGLDYAFYDTEGKSSLGYLRFKPHQRKPKKKAKHYHLHFITLCGNFRITANGNDSLIGVGDLAVIEKLVYYEIENITDDIGILMVIRQ